jgi:hypothetical protein
LLTAIDPRRRLFKHALRRAVVGRDECCRTPWCGALIRHIDHVIAASGLPRHLAEELGAVREIGNFAAHPMKSLATGAVLDVEPDEAEWNLEVLEHLFDFYFVELPGRKVRRHALEEKLKEAGRKPLAGT